MRPTIAIHIDSPYVTLDRYLQITGISQRTAEKQIEDGRLIMRPTPKGWKRSLREVNMLAMVMDAASSFDVQIVS